MHVATRMEIRDLRSLDWPEVAAIYEDGIRTGNATFELTAPPWEAWDAAHPEHRLVAELDGRVAGWAAIVPYSAREAYAGVGAKLKRVAGELAERGLRIDQPRPRVGRAAQGHDG